MHCRSFSRIIKKVSELVRETGKRQEWLENTSARCQSPQATEWLCCLQAKWLFMTLRPRVTALTRFIKEHLLWTQ